MAKKISQLETINYVLHDDSFIIVKENSTFKIPFSSLVREIVLAAGKNAETFTPLHPNNYHLINIYLFTRYI